MTIKQSDHVELYGIQMLRAIAALAVVVHHTLEESGVRSESSAPTG
ncbi:hypothetical protein QP175_12025 [Sphingomonas aerolata]